MSYRRNYGIYHYDITALIFGLRRPLRASPSVKERFGAGWRRFNLHSSLGTEYNVGHFGDLFTADLGTFNVQLFKSIQGPN